MLQKNINIDNSALCLSLLHELSPPSTVYIVGAGSGISNFIKWAYEKLITDVVLVEAVEKKYLQLKEYWSPEMQGWKFANMTVSNGFAGNIFFYANLSSESGLISTKVLSHIWPNIKSLNSRECNVATLQDIYKLDQKKENSWLILDYLIAAELLDKESLQNINVLVFRVALSDELPKEMNNCRFFSVITELGFRVAAKESVRNSKTEYWVCVRDVRQCLARVKEELDQAEILLSKNKDETHLLRTKLLEIEKKYEELKNVVSLKEKNRQQERIEREKLLYTKINNLENQISEQKNYIKQTTNALGQHITRSLLKSGRNKNPNDTD